MPSHFIVIDEDSTANHDAQHTNQPRYFGPYPTEALARQATHLQPHARRLRIIGLEHMPRAGSPFAAHPDVTGV